MKKFWVFYGALPVLLLTVFLTFGFASSTAAAPGSELIDTPVRFDVSLDSPDPNETLDLVNQERAKVGLLGLVADEGLGLVAKARAQDMANRQYYAHKDPDGKYYYDYFENFGVSAGYNCENLDLVFVPSQELVISEWMASLRGHRGCMMNATTTHAGYATTKLTLVNFDGSETTAYLVVAIHAQL